MGGNSKIALKKNNLIQTIIFLSTIFGHFLVYLFLVCSCELGQRFFTKFDKLAENINTRDDVKLAHVNCEADSELCETNGVNGN